MSFLVYESMEYAYICQKKTTKKIFKKVPTGFELGTFRLQVQHSASELKIQA